MANVKLVRVNAGDRKFISLSRSDIRHLERDFQVSIRPVRETDPNFRAERDTNVSPVLMVRPVFGDPRSPINMTVTANSSRAVIDFSNALPDLFHEDEERYTEDVILTDFQIPENKEFDMAGGINTLVFNNVYCSGILIDDTASDLSNGDIYVTIVF